MALSLSRKFLLSMACLAAAVGFTSCGSVKKDNRNKMIVSVRDQKLLLVRDGKPVKSYRISTSKFGIGDKPGSNCTPLGTMRIAKKIGGNAVAGTVFKSRRPTGEVLRPNAPGRDPIVSRILWLHGTEIGNFNAYRRYIYIHGTPEESRLGTPASYGCIRMGGRDVIDLYNRVGAGAEVRVIRGTLGATKEQQGYVARGGSIDDGV
ncbi:L,D-transpeptidase [Luteolibacter sp. SL250]|uniref:L,D-transpeptidase n=1 Tax=Luteolibacter sp. SL250 TaxID=2995170 RepID=UPI0022711754|nr:L,D-transpeptidase [Luteolibacter sp. SL250]WAC19786.1 L,D-transpeptidase [Luteolibacter sp. SL250]